MPDFEWLRGLFQAMLIIVMALALGVGMALGVLLALMIVGL